MLYIKLEYPCGFKQEIYCISILTLLCSFVFDVKNDNRYLCPIHKEKCER